MPETTGNKNGLRLWVAIVVLGVILAAIFASQAANRPAALPQVTQSASPAPTAASTTRADLKHPAHPEKNARGALIDGGIPNNLRGSGHLAECLDFILAHANRDFRSLHIYYNETFPIDARDVKDFYVVVKGKYFFSQFGTQAWGRLGDQWREWLAKGYISNGLAPVVGNNTFAGPGHSGFQISGPIRGDRSSLVFKVPGRVAFYILFRCGNVVTPVNHPLPHVPKCGPDVGAPTRKPCGTPLSGPEQQPVQHNPCCYTGPTAGYTSGNAEQVVNAQPTTKAVEPTQYGSDPGSCTNCSPGGTGSSGDPTPTPATESPQPNPSPSQPPATGNPCPDPNSCG